MELPDDQACPALLKLEKSTHALVRLDVPKDKKEEPMYYDLADGQKDGLVEVVKIREEKGKWKF